MFSERTCWNRQETGLALALEKLRSCGRAVLDLTRSNPTECGLAYDGEGIRRALTSGDVLQYRPDSRGIAEARDAVAAYYHCQHGQLIGSCDIVLTSGTSEAYSFLFRLICNVGDEVLIPAPGYPLFDFLADLCDVKLVRFPLVYDHGWQIDFGALAAVATERTRAVIVVHPNNPTGHYISNQEQSRLAQFCRERALALIVDEVFLDFSVGAGRARSFVACDQSLTFTLSGLSKICGLPQMKLAWIAVNGPGTEKREALARLDIIADAYLSVGMPVQLAASALLEMRGPFQQRVAERVRKNLGELDRHLEGQNACTRLAYQGGWTAVLRVPALHSDEDMALALLQNCKVLVHPGHFYDFVRPGHMVVSLIVPEHEFAEGTERVLAHFKI
jgi:aspartate/methionine/tyrosine aminotransferase